MTDKPHAHTLTAQILTAWCQSGRFAFIDKGTDLGKFLGSAYQELFNHIIESEEAEPGR